MGLDEDAAEYLAELPESKVREQALYLKKCAEFGYTTSASLCLLRAGVEPGTDVADMAVKLRDKLGFPEFAVDAILRDELSEESFLKLVEDAGEAWETWGSAWDGATDRLVVLELIEEMCKEALRDEKAKRHGDKLEEVLSRPQPRKRRAK